MNNETDQDSGFHLPEIPAFYTYSKPLQPILTAGPDMTICFLRDNEEVGRFDFGANPPTFTGDVDESARRFVEYVLMVFKGRIEEMVKQRGGDAD